MNPTRWPEVEAVLDATLDSDPSNWPVILDQRCAGDADLRREVEALLGRYASAQRFLDSPPVATATALVAEAQAASRTEGKRIGAYRIVRQIGHGGTARVYLAERDDGQFTQRVALKLLRPGHDSEIDQGRFRAERQILASLSHPNIARLLDGGMSDDGLPYLVMELIDGEPIDRYCDAHALPLRKRLEMFMTVCEATQYAHRNLVVHRDLKPSNVLVTAEGQVKLLDFGLAKLLERRPEDLASVPLTSQHWMTPEYAAPEQVRGEPATTLTDVYQLGVVLYELLTGTLPFGRREHSSYDLAHAILEREAPQPSSVSAHGGGSALRGDLDAIVLNALRKEPEQRYASVEALREDIQRHLTGMPVRARHGNALYRALKIVRRHRWSVAAAVTLLLLLTGYAVTLTMHARRMRATLARVEQEKVKAEGSTRFLLGLFSENVPGFGPRDTLTAQQLLARGERQADALRDQPLAHAQLLTVLGTIHYNMSVFDRAQTLLERALTLRRSALGEEHVDVAESMYRLGVLARSRGDNDRARELLSRALVIQLRVLGEVHPAVAETRYRLSLLGDAVDERIAAHRRALATSQRVHGPEHPVVAEDMMRLGTVLRDKGLLDDAEVLLRECLAMRRRVAGADHRSIARHLQQLAIVLKHKGELAEAEQLHRSQLATMESVVGPAHPELAGSLRGLAEVLILRREYDEAERLARRDVAIYERAFGEQHVRRAESLAFLSSVLQSGGKLQEAETLRRRELAIRRSTYGVDHPYVAGSMHNLATLLLDQREYAEAEQLLREAKSIRERHLGTESAAAATVLPGLARLARERGDFNAADSLLMRALRIFSAAGYDDRQQDVRQAYREQELLYEAWGKPDGAVQQRRLPIVRQE
jgi:tetratricopeptide (TPR) repeat protein/tRNA A-37 threonylcarbamoyl transferase component Bud32